jgi:hypothetical protein
VARIAQNVIGDQSIQIQIDDKNIDKATVSWLTQTYSMGKLVVLIFDMMLLTMNRLL